MKLNFTIVKHLNQMFKVKPTETILDARNNLFNEIKIIYADILFSPEQICFLFQNRILGNDERLDKLNIKKDVFVLLAVIGDEHPQYRRLTKKAENWLDRKTYIDDDGKVDWIHRRQYLQRLGDEQKIEVSLKIMGEKQMNVKNCTYPDLVGLEEPIRIASEILERRLIISSEYYKLIYHGTLLDPNKTFQDYKMQNGDEICVYKDSPRGNLEFFEIWLTTKDKISKPFEISQCLPLSDVINEQCLNIKTSFFWTSKQLELDIDESYAGGIKTIDVYFDVSQKFFTDMGFAGHGDLYQDYMSNIDWMKREHHLEKLPRDRKMKLILNSKTGKPYPLLVDPQESMDIALKYHQDKFRISNHCSLIKGDTAMDILKTFEDGGIKENDIITVSNEPIAFKASFTSSVMVIPDDKKYNSLTVPAYFSLNEIMDNFCQLFGLSPGSCKLYEDEEHTEPITNEDEYLNAKQMHAAMTTWRHIIEREMKVYLVLSKCSTDQQTKNKGKLGAGAFGNVSLFEESNYMRKYAWKIIKNSTDKYSKSFQRETDSFNKLGFHPGIVRYFCFTKVGDVLSIFMENMPGGSLRQYLDKNERKPMKEPDIINYADQILKALHYLHENQFIHRDVRGDNILLDGKGIAKLADFGIARKLEESETESITGTYGNYHFMAPEMMLGEEYGTKVDIWSFGATMIEMMTGRIPMPTVNDLGIEKLMRTTKQIKFAFPKGSSNKIKTFTNSCLKPTAQERPTAAQLLFHEFLA